MNQLITKQMFHNMEVEFYKNEDNFLFTMEQVSQLAGYKDTDNFKKMLQSHPELRESRSSLLLKVDSLEGGILKKREKRFFTEEGLYEVLMVSGTAKGIEVRRFVAGILSKLRKGEVQLGATKQLPANLESSLSNIENIATKLLEDSTNEVLPTLENITKEIQNLRERVESIENKQKEVNLSVSITQKAMEDMMGEFEVLYEKLGH